VKKIDNKRLKLLDIKGNDYSRQNKKSRFDNFQRMAKLVKVLGLDLTRPHMVALFMSLLKIDRYTNLTLTSRKPKNESIEDTILDLHNYVDLSYGAWLEETQQRKQEE
jgi:hypothetical protein